MKLSSGKEVGPFPQVVGAKDMEISFDFLVGWFSLSISLWVICGGEFDIIVEESSQFSCKRKGELWAFVGYQGVMKAKAFEYMVEEISGHSSCIYSF